jgi:hypothetical protein
MATLEEIRAELERRKSVNPELEAVRAELARRKETGWNPLSSVASAVSGIRDAVVGTRDEAVGDLPTYAPTTPEALLGQAQAKSVTFSDDAYADILAKQLGTRFKGLEQDANGYPIINYIGDDGKVVRAYVNQPGLDWQDVDRGLSATVPYIVSGGLVGKAAQGAGTIGRMVLQGLTGAGTSIGQDVVANQMGSEQPLDLARAGFAGVGGAFGEAIAPVATGVMRAWRGGKRFLDDAGNLTEDAAQVARKAGIDPATLDKETAEMFAEGLNVGRDPKEIASWIKTNKFGLLTTKATRTKDPELSAIEKDIRAGNLGPDAKTYMQGFDEDVQKRLRESALNKPTRPLDQPVDPYEHGMGAMVAPTRMDTTPDTVTPGVLGSSIQQSLKAAKDKGDEAVSEAYKGVGFLEPTDEAWDAISPIIRNKLGNFRLNAQTPTANTMIEDIIAFKSGKTPQGEAAEFIGQTPSASLVDQQKALFGIYKGAVDPADRTAAKAVYDGFNDWIDEIASNGWVKGDPATAANLRTARGVTREIKGMFDPRGKAIDPATAKILKNITDKDQNADSIVTELFGGAGSGKPPKGGSIQALNQIKTILNDKRLVDPEDAARTWNDIRMAYWSKLVLDNKGNVASPTVASNNLDMALRNQAGVFNALFEPAERKIMKEYAEALKEAAFKDPNPSGTATALRGLMKNDGSWLKTLLQTQSKRELFSKHNVFMSRVYQILAKKVPVDVMGTKGAAGVAAARRATDQKLTPKPNATLGQFGSAAGAMYGADDLPPVRGDIGLEWPPKE